MNWRLFRSEMGVRQTTTISKRIMNISTQKIEL